MTEHRRQELDLYRKACISFSLMGVLPFLLICYLFIREEISISNTIILCAAVVLFSMLMGFTLLRRSADQLQLLVRETAQVKRDSLARPLTVQVDGELKEIATSFNSLVKRLEQAQREIQEQNIQLLTYADELEQSYEKLRREEQVRDHLARYVGRDLLEQMLADDGAFLCRNQRRIVTILFADIRGFTAIAEDMDPEAVISLLNEYYNLMVEIIFANTGILDKFIGDQLMAVFGQLCDRDEGAHHALLAALEMQKAIEQLMHSRNKDGQPVFEVGIGINTGEVLIGNVGSANRMDYTVIGDTVNAAARLEEQARGGEIIISEQTLSCLPRKVSVGEPVQLRVKNRLRPITCYCINRKKYSTPLAQRSVPCSQGPDTVQLKPVKGFS